MKPTQPKFENGIPITNPWNDEMYEYNDMVGSLMKEQIEHQVNLAEERDDWKTLNQLITLCGGTKWAEGHVTIGELWEKCLDELEMVQNYWLNEEYPYFVSKGLVKDIKLNFVGYGK